MGVILQRTCVGEDVELLECLITEIKRGNFSWRDLIFYCWEYFQEEELEERLSWI